MVWPSTSCPLTRLQPKRSQFSGSRAAARRQWLVPTGSSIRPHGVPNEPLEALAPVGRRMRLSAAFRRCGRPDLTSGCSRSMCWGCAVRHLRTKDPCKCDAVTRRHRPSGVGEPVKFQVAGEAGQASAPLNERPRASPEDANVNPVESYSVECSECGGDVGDLEAGDECPTCGATARTHKVGQSP